MVANSRSSRQYRPKVKLSSQKKGHKHKTIQITDVANANSHTQKWIRVDIDLVVLLRNTLVEVY